MHKPITTYVISNVNNVLQVSQTTIEAIAVAASVAAGFGGTGWRRAKRSGADATNVI